MKKHIFWSVSFVYSLILSIVLPDSPKEFSAILIETLGMWVWLGVVIYILTHLGKNKKDSSRNTIAFWISTTIFGMALLGRISDLMSNLERQQTDMQIPISRFILIFFIICIIIKIINGRTPVEYSKGKMGHCSICGKSFAPDLPVWKKALMWWFCSKEYTMTCPECRQERSKQKKVFKCALETALKDEFLDREQEKQLLESLAKVQLSQLVIDSKNDLEYVRRLTGYKMGDFVGIPVSDIALKENEKLLFEAQVSLYQVRSKTRYRGRSEGFTFRLAKGVSYRTGVFRGEPVREQYLNLEGNGTLYVTNMRVIFNGCRNLTYKWENILQVISFPPDGISFSVENKTTFHLLKLTSSDPRDIKELIVCCEAILGNRVKE